MCRSLLYGIAHRDDAYRLVAYTAWRYGMANVLRIMAARFAVLLRRREAPTRLGAKRAAGFKT
jgi:hypothetical protein